MRLFFIEDIFSRWYMDFLELFIILNKDRYFFLVVDSFLKWCEVFFLKFMEVIEVVRVFFVEIFVRYGVLRIFILDWG